MAPALLFLSLTALFALTSRVTVAGLALTRDAILRALSPSRSHSSIRHRSSYVRWDLFLSRASQFPLPARGTQEDSTEGGAAARSRPQN